MRVLFRWWWKQFGIEMGSSMISHHAVEYCRCRYCSRWLESFFDDLSSPSLSVYFPWERHWSILDKDILLAFWSRFQWLFLLPTHFFTVLLTLIGSKCLVVPNNNQRKSCRTKLANKQAPTTCLATRGKEARIKTWLQKRFFPVSSAARKKSFGRTSYKQQRTKSLHRTWIGSTTNSNTMNPLRSQRTRWFAYTIVGFLGLTQVLLYKKIQSVQNHENVFLPDIHRGNNHRKTIPGKSEKPAYPPTNSLYTLPDGTTCKVANRAQDIPAVVESLHNAADNDGALSFCLPWHVNSDEWWTHNVEWEIGYEDDTHYCFRRIQNVQKRQLMLTIYQNQFKNDCSQPVYKKMWNSGISNDLRNVVDGLKYSTETTHRPFDITIQPWHYASPKPFNISTAACPSQDMYCYFLPLSNCPRVPVNDTIKKIGFLDRGAVLGPKLFVPPARWYLEFVSRQQTWLRHRVYKFVQRQTVDTPCTALHVRRGDIITHGTHSRRYFSIAEYMNTTHKIERNVFLLTDDHNAIGEALHEFPDRHWMYIDRPRYRGSEGGFEHHLPSNDPVLEMTVLLATFKLVRRCTSMVRSSSAFGDFLWGEIKDQHDMEDIWFRRVDENLRTIFSADNIVISANVSKAYDVQHRWAKMQVSEFLRHGLVRQHGTI